MSILDLVDPSSPEYRQGREAFQAGDSYETCPYPPATGKKISVTRFNWFSGYWAARAHVYQPARAEAETIRLGLAARNDRKSR